MSYSIEPGDPYQLLLSNAFEAQRTATIQTLNDSKGIAAIDLLMREVISRAGQVTLEAAGMEPPARDLACGKGCHYCCSATVGVVAPEVLFLAEQLRRRLPADEFSALQARSERLRRKLSSLDRGAKLEARIPCALLRNGACSAYDARPLACRWTNSPSLRDCLDILVYRTRVVLEMEEVRYQPIQEVWQGLRAGLRGNGLDGSLLALDEALATALSQPDAAEQYLRGETIFEDARLG